MSASESTKFQVNFKTPDGTLINLYAQNKEELEALLTAAQDFSTLIASVSQSLGGAASPAPVRTGFPPKQVAAPVASGDAPSCDHGPMTFIKGVNARGPWSGYKCSGPEGTKPKCKTIFNRS
jgi:hypothetical protein